MSRRISTRQRLIVETRADHRCEYCLLHESDSFFPHEVDHVISLKHNGAHHLDNFAYSCFACNRYKGSDLGTYLSPDEPLTRLFHPRKDQWHQHFRLEGALIQPLSDIGTATIQILRLNHPDRLLERQSLIVLGRYPG